MSITSCRIFRVFFFFLALRRTSDIGASPSLSVSLSSSWSGLADTDSESAIFSSGLLALFYLCFCDACTPFSSPRVLFIRRQRSLVRSFLFFLRMRPTFSLFRLSSSPSHSQPDPDLRLRPGQCLNFGLFERMAVWSPQDVGQYVNTLSYFNIRLTLAKVAR